jgi:hypothetical protein
MFEKPKIPMRPEDVPQQRLKLVVELPPRPAGFKGNCQFYNPMPEEVEPKRGPRKPVCLGSVEWAWDPNYSRVDSYYLSSHKSYWLLWIGGTDENSWDLKWRWVPYAYAPKSSVDEKNAAIYLLLDAWMSEASNTSLDHYHWIDCPDLLSVAEISEIARNVWPNGPEEEPLE